MTQDISVNNEPVAIITGGSRGIGAATAKLLGEKGYRICVNYRRNEAAANAVVSDLKSCGASAIAVQANIGKEDDTCRLFEIVDRQLGPVTALVNNAGILLPQSRVEDMAASRINEILETNVTGAFLCCREAVKRMSTKHGGGGGSIVNVSSAASRIGAAGEYVDYAASKGAVDTLTRGLALEVAGEGIRVNCVRPGFIYTEMHADGGEPDRVARLADSIPLQRGGTPEEVANAIFWLLSDDASYSTGSFIDLAGGR
jgi:NAD(P)-dependent dehydrogenase (short-subunit alcohol dehydrogenase family)